ncbi:MAG: hypothetical protein AB7V26_03300 [Lysobacterales bacterium]
MRFALFASAALGADASLAQSCNNGVCPPIEVVGHLPGGSGGSGFRGSGLTGSAETSFEWQWQDEGGRPIAQPPPEALCPAVRASWQAHNCANTPRTSGFNGCGSGWTSGLVPDTSLFTEGLSFTDTCNNHDTCYGSLGVPKLECDRGLLTGMSAVCHSARRHWQFEAAELGMTLAQRTAYVNQQETECVGQGIIYFGALQSFGLPAYRNAQASAACSALLALSNDAHCGLH